MGFYVLHCRINLATGITPTEENTCVEMTPTEENEYAEVNEYQSLSVDSQTTSPRNDYQALVRPNSP